MARNGIPRKYTLRERLAWPSTLLQAFVEVTRRARPSSAGPDRMTVDSFRRDAKAQIRLLRAEIKAGAYAPATPRGVAIPKDAKRGAVKGNVRSISVFNVRDRIVQRGISNLIWPYLRSKVYSEVSFGGIRPFKSRKGVSKTCTEVRKNVRAAAERILTLKKDGYEFTFETDIQNFYPSIDKSLLLSGVLQCLTPDNSIKDLLERAIDTTASNIDDLEARGLSEYWDSEVGVPQGGVLSPLFANFYLAPFDKALVDAGFRPIRYVDDLVIPTKSRADAERAYELCRAQLASFGLTIHELGIADAKGRTKTRIAGPDQHFDFLGLRFHKRSLHPCPPKVEELQSRIKAATHAFTSEPTLVSVISKLNRLLRGWMAAYSFCDIPKGTLQTIDHCAGSGLVSWMRFHELLRAKSLSAEKRKKIGLWSVYEYQLSPLSKLNLSKDLILQSKTCLVARSSDDPPF
jgi:RNA-directed DNA polymerase